MFPEWLMQYSEVLIQVADFLWKACTAYAATPEGGKELQDVIKAVEATGVQASARTVRTAQASKNAPTPAAPASERGLG